MTTVSIYGLLDPRTQELRYVGKTHESLDERFKKHKTDKTKTHKCYWFHSVIRAGYIPEIFLIEESNETDWQEDERFWISYFRFIGCNLTNSRSGGEGGSFSEETKSKISATKIGQNRKHTDEYKEKQRRDSLERWQNPAYREKVTPLSRANAYKMHEANKGGKHTEEHKKKISDAHKGRLISQETRDRMSVAQRKRKLTPEQRERMLSGVRAYQERCRAKRIVLGQLKLF